MKNKNGTNGLRLTARFVVLYVALLAVFTLAMWGAYCIPVDAVRGNVASSEQQIIAELKTHETYSAYLNMDYFTDGLMYSETVTANDRAGAFHSAMLNRFFFNDSVTPAATGREVALGNRTDARCVVYGRYWHGYIAPLKTVSLLMPLQGVRTLNYLLIGLLFVGCIVAICRRRGVLAAIAFLTALTITFAFIMPSSPQYSSCLYITLASVLAVMVWTPRLERNGNAYLLFFALGALTTFFDLLTAPLMTLGYALALYLYRSDIGDKYKTATLICVAWAAGYGLLWASKWLLVSVFTDFSIFENIVNAAATRIADPITWKPHYISHRVLPAYLIAIALTLGASYLFGARLTALRKSGWLLAVALLPLAWMAILNNHTSTHFFFVWRIAGVTVLCCILYFFSAVKPDHE